jgi:hypothetical protein
MPRVYICDSGSAIVAKRLDADHARGYPRDRELIDHIEDFVDAMAAVAGAGTRVVSKAR